MNEKPNESSKCDHQSQPKAQIVEDGNSGSKQFGFMALGSAVKLSEAQVGRRL